VSEQRKPPGLDWETWIDRLIRQAQERGEFDQNSLRGKPIPSLGRRRPDDWFAQQLMAREGVEQLPKTIRVRKNLDRALEEIAAAGDEDEVRRIVADINEQILEVNRKAASGPPSNMMPLDLDRVLATWREGHGRKGAEPS
jgi:hypothetical protein